MAETIRIEIPIETVDKTDPELSNVVRNLGRMEDAADRAGGAAERAVQRVSKFDQSAEKTQKSLAKWAKEKYEILLAARDKVSPVLSTLGSGLRGITGRAWSVTVRAFDFVTAPLRGILNLLRNPVFQVGAVLGISLSLGSTINTYRDFEAAMSQVQAISSATGAELGKLTSKAEEMGSTTKFTAENAAEAMKYMAMAGWKTADMLDGIEGIMNLAAASGEDLGTTSDIVTDALTAFGLKASDSAHFADVLAAASSNANTNVGMMGETFKYVGTMAGSMGYRIEDVSLAVGLMANSGLKGSMAGTALNTIITRLATNTDSATDAIRELGVEFYNSDGSARHLKDIMDELRDVTRDMTDEQKASLGKTVAGVEGQKGLLAILNATTEDYEKLTEAVNSADGAAARMSDTMLDNLSGSITLLQSAADGVKIAFGGRLAPYVRELADYITGSMPAIEAGLDKFMDFVDRKMDKLRTKFDEISSSGEWQSADFLGKVKIVWDEIIAEPFLEWWNRDGKAMLSEVAGSAGRTIGSGIHSGIMLLLGIDVSGTAEEGASVGRAFAAGFSEGLDFEQISGKLSEGFQNMLSSAGKLLPGGQSADIGSLISAYVLAKVAKPFIGMGRGGFSIGRALFGASEAGGKSLLGSMVGSAGKGSGLLGFGANTAINLGAGNLAGGASLSTGALSTVGLGAAAGGLAAGATLVSGALDAYTAVTSDDKKESDAYGESAAWKVGGVAAGAAAGAAIGSVVPVLGTAVGALIGAGVGGIAGWIKGNKVKEEYEENLEAAQEAAAKAQKVFEATGMSIEDVTFGTQELNDAVNDTGVSAEQLGKMFREAVNAELQNKFGDISLSLKEIQEIAGKIVFDKQVEGIEKFSEVTLAAKNALSSFRSQVRLLDKMNWKAGLGIKLDEDESEEYQEAVSGLAAQAKEYLEKSHYEGTVAMRLIIGSDSGDWENSLNNTYTGLQAQIDEISGRLSTTVSIALEDGVITLDEEAEITSLQQQIEDITNKLAKAQENAQFEAMEIKYSGAAADAESFAGMQEELQKNVADLTENYDNALTVSLTNLQLQLSEGAISQDEYNTMLEELAAGYQANISGLSVRVESFQMDSIAEAFAGDLDGILPEMEGTLSERLTTAMHNAMAIQPDPAKWTNDDMVDWFGLEGLIPETEAAVRERLKATAYTIPEAAKEGFLEELKASVPTEEEIAAVIDFTKLNWKDYSALTGGDGTFLTSADSDFSVYDKLLSGSEENFDEQCKAYAKKLHESLERNLDPEEIRDFISTYMSGTYESSGPDVPAPGENLWDFSEYAQTAGNGLGEELIKSTQGGIEANTPQLRLSAEDAVSSAFVNPFNVEAQVEIAADYNIEKMVPIMPVPSIRAHANGGILPSSVEGAAIGAHAAGGLVSGRQLSWVGEEGPEIIIPMVPGRRARAMELYEQAGEMLGVGAHAAGGLVGAGNIAPIPAENAEDVNVTGDVMRNAPYGYNEAMGEQDDEAESASVPVGNAGEAASGHSVQVSVQVSPEFHISGAEGQSEEDILKVIRRHMKEMADELGGEIASRLEDVFSNMPLKEA